MGDMAKAVCLLSERSTRTIVDKAWDRVSTDNKESCLKTSRESYVYLAKCLSSAPGRSVSRQGVATVRTYSAASIRFLRLTAARPSTGARNCPV
jgi:hypothetical protein